MRVLLWRHGRTEWNDVGRFQGWTDVPLDQLGQAQAVAAAPLIDALGPALVLSSDSLRARQTAQALGQPFRTDKRLREIDVGAWSGLTAPEAAERFPEENAAWRRGEDVRRGGGETYAEVGARAMAVMDDLAAGGELGRDDLVVVTTHGGTSRSLIGSLLRLPPEAWWSFGPLGNCRWSLLQEFDRGFRLVEHNVGVQAVAVSTVPSQPAAPPPGTGTPSPDVEPVQ